MEPKLKEDRDACRLCAAWRVLAWMPPVAEKFEHHQRRADDDCRVGDVERVPVIVAEVKIDEVGDAAAQDAVENVARARRRESARVRTGPAHPPARSGREQPHQQHNHGDGEKNQHRRPSTALSNPRSRPNATPGLLVCTRFSESGDQHVAASRPVIDFSTAYLLTWSATSAAKRNKRQRVPVR